MLKKMRRRFVGTAMSAFTAVILILLLSVNTWNFYTTTTQLDSTISVLQTISNDFTLDASPDIGSETTTVPDLPMMFPMGQFSPEVQYMIRFFSVSYDTEGNMTDINQDYIASVSSDDARSYADTVLRLKQKSGFYSGYRYQISTDSSGTQIVFLNAERELQTMRNLLVITLVIALGCLAAVFLLVYLFSKRAIAPFARNMEAQKEFITNASHELKTPLTSISTSADVLAMENPDDEWIHNIRSQSAQMSVLIGQMVALTRLDEEHPLPEKTEVSLSDLAWELAEPFSSRAHASGKQFSLQIEDRITVIGDQASLQQLLSVLLDNALKYSDQGGSITLQVSCQGRKALLQVTNTFAGAETLDTSRLFERFYRGNTSHGKEVNGSGIGLSIAKAAAEANGGHITVGTSTDQVCFRVLLPRKT